MQVAQHAPSSESAFSEPKASPAQAYALIDAPLQKAGTRLARDSRQERGPW